MSLRARFEKKFVISPNSGCWLWTASMDKRGRGQIAITAGKPRTASRVSWELYKGAIPEGLSVLHTCDNPRCVNPDHLFLGTQDDNMKDAAKKGRHAKSISNEEVAEITKLYETGKYTKTKLGKLYGTGHKAIEWLLKKRQHGT